MRQGLKIINEIVEDLDNDIVDLVELFGTKPFIQYIEGELVIDPRYKKIIDIIAVNNFARDYEVYNEKFVNLTTTDFRIYERYVHLVSFQGDAPIILRAELLLFILKAYCITGNVNPLEVLKEFKTKKMYRTRKTLKSIFEFYIGKRKEKEIVSVEAFDSVLLAVLTGKTVMDMSEVIYNKYKDDLEVNVNV